MEIISTSDCDIFIRQNKKKFINVINRFEETEIKWLSSAVYDQGGVCVVRY